MEWSGQGSETAVMGYNSNGNYFLNHPANGFPDIGRIISCTMYLIPDDREKRQATTVEVPPSGECPADPEAQGQKQLCRQFADADDNLIKNIDTLTNSEDQNWQILSKCPATKSQLEISTEFRVFAQQTGDCFRSKNAFVPSLDSLQTHHEFVSVCCYDTIG